MAEPVRPEVSRGDLARRVRWQAGGCREMGSRAPKLARFYPSVGGTAELHASWPALRDALGEHRGELRGLLDQPPQTNEVGRAASLIGGLLHVVDRWPGPLRLFEIGASAGLNLRADHFRVEPADGSGVGPADSPVVLPDPWLGPRPPGAGPLHVVERHGCDTAPIDPTTEEGRLRLTSYVWPDQRARLDRLRGALAIASRVPATVVRRTARDFVEDLGDTADSDARLAHLALEPRRRTPSTDREVLVVLRMWPGGVERVLGSASAHGIPTTWE